MQIESIVLYKAGKKPRVLPFTLGTVNIVTGKSYTGKSSIIDIVEYCLGSSNNIPHNKIKNNVEWFGIKIIFPEYQVFIARENPQGKKQSSNAMFLKGVNLNIPQQEDLKITDDIGTILEKLTGYIGIDGLSDNGSNFSRDQFTATLRHASKFMYQDQETIASKRRLFYRDEDSFVKQSIKDTIGYFLGAIREDDLLYKEELDRVKKKYRKTKRKLDTYERIHGEDVDKMISLVEEAGAVGLINIEDVYCNQSTEMDSKVLIDILKKLAKWKFNYKENVPKDRITLLQDEHQNLGKKAQLILNRIKAAKDFASESNQYTKEVVIQINRLETIDLYKRDPSKQVCPLCSQEIEEQTPKTEAINRLMERLSFNLSKVNKERPNLRKYIEKLENERAEVLAKRESINEIINGLIEEWEEAKEIKSLDERRARVVGRISLFVESYEEIDENSLLRKKLLDFEKEIERLEDLLDPEEQEIRLHSALHKINTYMTEMAKKLDFEYSGEFLRFDSKRLTVFVDLDNDSIPLSGIGSAANYVSLHLVTFLALHKFFIQNKRPVPTVLFIDQPTQAYYEPDPIDDEYHVKDEDREAVTRIYNLLFEVTKEMKGKLQIIITDHAYLSDHTEFEKSVVEVWRNETGKALVPYDWIED